MKNIFAKLFSQIFYFLFIFVLQDDGTAIIDITDSIALLDGKDNVMHRAVVIHEKADDLGKGGDEGSKKTGNAGARIACGVIGSE